MIKNGDAEMALTIVDGHESDFMKGKISLFSPIGRGLMGRRAGEKVEVATINGKVIYIVLQIT